MASKLMKVYQGILIYAGNTYAGARIFFVLKEDLPFKTYITFVA